LDLDVYAYVDAHVHIHARAFLDVQRRFAPLFGLDSPFHPAVILILTSRRTYIIILRDPPDAKRWPSRFCISGYRCRRIDMALR
jgi:hypothetical protein